MKEQTLNEASKLRDMAESLDCFLEDDFRALAGATPNTVEAWRKRGTGPAYVRLGNRYLYPRKAVSEYLQSVTRERKSFVKGLL